MDILSLQILVIRIDVVGLLDFCKFCIGDALEGLGILNKMLIVQSKQREKLANNRVSSLQSNYLPTYFSALSSVSDIMRVNSVPGLAF